MNEVIRKIYQSRSVTDEKGNVYPLNVEVDEAEGKLLYNTIQQDRTILKTLEVGCAYGLSSLHICEALKGRKGASHTIIDPYQYIDYFGIGIKHLNDAGIDFYNLIEKKSEFALPILTEEMEGQFDFIFIDGWHTFDHTMLDCFYANRLLKVGGVLVVDDVNMPGVRAAVDFISSYPCYILDSSTSIPRKNKAHLFLKLILTPFKMLGLTRLLKSNIQHKIFENNYYTCFLLKKTKEDNRAWNWHSSVM